MSKQERIASKVKKLLAIANDDAASGAEIQNAMNHAQRLMDAHHLTEDDLNHEPVDDYSKVDQADFDQMWAYVGGRVFFWEKQLATFVSRFVGVPVYLENGKHPVRVNGIIQMDGDEPKYGQAFVFYGVAEDAAIAIEVYDELRTLIATMAVARWGGVYKGDGASYSQGFVTGLFDQLHEAKRIEKQTTTGLILSCRRSDLIQYKNQKAREWLYKSKGFKLRKAGTSRGTRTGSSSAYSEGRTDGSSTNVSATRMRKLN